MGQYLQGYEKAMNDYDDALKLITGCSGLVIPSFMQLPLWFPNCSRQGTVISIKGTDGNIYTGVAIGIAEHGKRFSDECGDQIPGVPCNLILTFGFGEIQSRKPLENRVFEFGFSISQHKLFS